MNADDPRIRAIRQRIDDKRITTFRQIFNNYPRSEFACALEMETKQLRQSIENPARLNVRNLIKLVVLIGIDIDVMMELIFHQLEQEKKYKRQKLKTR